MLIFYSSRHFSSTFFVMDEKGNLNFRLWFKLHFQIALYKLLPKTSLERMFTFAVSVCYTALNLRNESVRKPTGCDSRKHLRVTNKTLKSAQRLDGLCNRDRFYAKSAIVKAFRKCLRSGLLSLSALN